MCFIYSITKTTILDNYIGIVLSNLGAILDPLLSLRVNGSKPIVYRPIIQKQHYLHVDDYHVYINGDLFSVFS